MYALDAHFVRRLRRTKSCELNTRAGSIPARGTSKARKCLLRVRYSSVQREYMPKPSSPSLIIKASLARSYIPSLPTTHCLCKLKCVKGCYRIGTRLCGFKSKPGQARYGLQRNGCSVRLAHHSATFAYNVNTSLPCCAEV